MSRAGAAVTLLLLASCATLRAPATAPPGWTYPPSYEANQVVTVTEGGVRRELLASVRRQGEEIDVTLFDAALATPVLTASLRDRKATETRLVEAIPAGSGERLLRLLSELHGARFVLDASGQGEAAGFLARYRVQLTGAPAECTLPAAVEVQPRFGGVAIRVETVDGGCPAGPPAG